MSRNIVLSELQRSLATLFDWARVDPKTLTRYRRMSNIRLSSKKTTELNAKLLVAALMYRPADKAELKDIYLNREREIQEIFAMALTREAIQIEEPVPSNKLAAEIAKAGGAYRSDRTLKRYAAIISKRSRCPVDYPSEDDYPPEVATAFARLSLEMIERKRDAGHRAAAKRWSAAEVS